MPFVNFRRCVWTEDEPKYDSVVVNSLLVGRILRWAVYLKLGAGGVTPVCGDSGASGDALCVHVARAHCYGAYSVITFSPPIRLVAQIYSMHGHGQGVLAGRALFFFYLRGTYIVYSSNTIRRTVHTLAVSNAFVEINVVEIVK